MCQKRDGLPRSKVSSAPEVTAPQNANEYAVRMTGRSSGRPNHSRVAARKYAPPAMPPTKKYGMMNHVQCGDAVKKVSDIHHSFLLVHPPFPDSDQREHAEHRGRRHRQRATLLQAAAGKLRIGGQAVHLGIVDEKIEGVQATQRPIRIVTVEPRPRFSLSFELLHALLRADAQLADGPELDRISRTRFGTGGLEPDAHAIVTERALLRRARDHVHIDDAKGTAGDAGAAAVAHIRLDHHGVELGADDRASRAHLDTAGFDAMLAHVAHHEPAAVVRAVELLDELDVPPVRAVELACVVVAVARHLRHAAVCGRQLIPVFARDLACFAIDTHRRVSEEPHRLVGNGGALARDVYHITLAPRCRRTLCLRGSTRWDRRPMP